MPAVPWHSNLVKKLEQESSALAPPTCKKYPQGRNFSQLTQREGSNTNSSPAASRQQNLEERICQLGISALAPPKCKKGPQDLSFSQFIQREGSYSDSSSASPRHNNSGERICQLGIVTNNGNEPGQPPAKPLTVFSGAFGMKVCKAFIS